MEQTAEPTPTETAPVPNIALLREIQAAILEEPKRANMSTWGNTFHPNVEYDRTPICNTVGCIAGWAISISLKMRGVSFRHHLEVINSSIHVHHALQHHVDRVWGGAFAEGRELLGLTPSQAIKLFIPSRWDAPFHSKINAMANIDEGTPQYALLISRYIDYFIETYLTARPTPA